MPNDAGCNYEMIKGCAPNVKSGRTYLDRPVQLSSRRRPSKAIQSRRNVRQKSWPRGSTIVQTGCCSVYSRTQAVSEKAKLRPETQVP